MSERGVFAVDRGIWDHPLFAREPFTEREAWVWMISAAAWKPIRVRVGRTPVALCRGQLAFSERFLAEKWRWSKSRVHRFLDRLKTEAMTSQQTDHETNLITICNYERYAFDGTARGPRAEPQPEPLADQPRTKEEELKEVKKEKKEYGAVAIATRPSDAFEDFWKVYPKRDGANPKAPAKSKFIAAVRSGVEAPTIIAAAGRYASETRSKGQFGTPYVAQAKTWLSQQRYGDYQPQPPPGGQPTSIPKGAPTDEELRKRYGRPNSDPTVHPKAETHTDIGGRSDHVKELQPEGFGFLPGLRSF